MRDAADGRRRRPESATPLGATGARLDVQVATPWLHRVPPPALVRPFARWFDGCFYVDIGHRCNQSCRYCFQDKTDAHFLSAGELEPVIAAAESVGLKRAIVIGGEPLLYPGLEALIARLRRGGIREWGLMTNGIGLAEDGRLDRLMAEGLGFCQISLDSSSPRVQNDLARNPRLFQKIEKALALLGRHPDLTLVLNAVIVRPNVGRLTELVRYADSLRRTRGLRPFLTLTHAKPHGAMDPKLMVSATEAAAAVSAAVQEGSRLGLPVLFRNLPPCLMNGLERWSTDWFTRLSPVETRKAESCSSCAHDGTCLGFPSGYAERFGADEFQPIRIPRVAPAGDKAAASVSPRGARVKAAEIGPGLGEGLTASLLLGTSCNFRCEFCYLEEHRGTPTRAKAIAAVDALLSMGCRRFLLAGGEPTLYPHLSDVARRISAAGAEAILVSNGFRLADRSFTRRLADVGIKRAILSLHSHRTETFSRLVHVPGALPKTLAGFFNLVRENIHVTIHHVFYKGNCAEFPAYVRFYADHLRRPGLTEMGVSNIILLRPNLGKRPDCVPRLSEVRPPLEAGVLLARQRGFEINRGGSEDAFPECVYGAGARPCERPPQERRIVMPSPGEVGFIFAGARGELPDLNDLGAKDYNKIFVHKRACRSCRRKATCLGIQAGYAALYGDGELRSIP